MGTLMVSLGEESQSTFGSGYGYGYGYGYGSGDGSGYGYDPASVMRKSVTRI